MDQWTNGPMDQWTNGTLEHWNIRILENWNIETLEHWKIGTLEHWSIQHSISNNLHLVTWIALILFRRLLVTLVTSIASTDWVKIWKSCLQIYIYNNVGANNIPICVQSSANKNNFKINLIVYNDNMINHDITICPEYFSFLCVSHSHVIQRRIQMSDHINWILRMGGSSRSELPLIK